MFNYFRYATVTAGGKRREFDDLSAFRAAMCRKHGETSGHIYFHDESTVSAGAGGARHEKTIYSAGEIDAAIAAVEAAAAEATTKVNRPFIWADRRPDAFRDHMRCRPAGISRKIWAESISDTSLDGEKRPSACPILYKSQVLS